MSEPMYRVIAEDLRRQIESGELKPGQQLQTEVELRERYGQDGKASRNTVRDAIKLLVGRGLVVTRPGQGTFVARKKTKLFVSKLSTADPQAGGVEDEVYKTEVERQGRIPEESRPRVEVQNPSDVPDVVPSLLQLDEGAQIISRHQQRKIDGTPYSMQTTFYPYPADLLQRYPPAARLLEATSVEGGMVQYLKDHLGIIQAGWRDTINARPATGEEMTFFGLSDRVQTAMFEFRRTSFDKDGKPIRVTITVYPADRNHFELEAGDVPPPTDPPSTAALTGSEPDGEESPAGSVSIAGSR